MSKGKIAIGAVIGAVAGVIAGFLTAPKAGKDTRSDLRRRAEEIKAETSKQVKKLQDK